MPGRSNNLEHSNGQENSRSMEPDGTRLTREGSRLWLNRENSRLYLQRENSRLYLNREGSKINLAPVFNRESSRLNLSLKREESRINMGLTRENSRLSVQASRHERKRLKKQPSKDVEQFMNFLRHQQGGSIQRETTDLRIRKRQPLPGIGESPRDRNDVPFLCVDSEDTTLTETRRHEVLASAPSPDSDIELDLNRVNRRDTRQQTSSSPPPKNQGSPPLSRRYVGESIESPIVSRKNEQQSYDSPSVSRKLNQNTDTASIAQKFGINNDQLDSPSLSRKFVNKSNLNVGDDPSNKSNKYNTNNSNRHRMNINQRSGRMVNTGKKLLPLTRRATAGHFLPPLIQEEIPDRPTCPQPSRTPPHPDSNEDCFDNNFIKEEPIDYMDLE